MYAHNILQRHVIHSYTIIKPELYSVYMSHTNYAFAQSANCAALSKDQVNHSMHH